MILKIQMLIIKRKCTMQIQMIDHSLDISLPLGELSKN